MNNITAETERSTRRRLLILSIIVVVVWLGAGILLAAAIQRTANEMELQPIPIAEVQTYAEGTPVVVSGYIDGSNQRLTEQFPLGVRERRQSGRVSFGIFTGSTEMWVLEEQVTPWFTLVDKQEASIAILNEDYVIVGGTTVREGDTRWRGVGADRDRVFVFGTSAPDGLIAQHIQTTYEPREIGLWYGNLTQSEQFLVDLQHVLMLIYLLATWVVLPPVVLFWFYETMIRTLNPFHIH